MSQRAVGWSLVAVQAALLVAMVLVSGGDDWVNPAPAAQAARAAMGGGLVLAGVAALGLGSALTPTPVPKSGDRLRTGGLYRWVRHPIYSGVLLFVVGAAVASESFIKLAIGVVTVVFFNVKARWEEARLCEAYPGYGAYASRTARFVPRWRRRSAGA